MIWLGFLLLCIVPVETVTRERCDVIEHNRFYDERGNLVFSQLIFMDWYPQCGRYQVRAWRPVKNPRQVPNRNWRTGGYTLTWMDGENLRTVEADSIRDSWTQHDPEIAERDILAKERRTELRKPEDYLHLKLKQMGNQ